MKIVILGLSITSSWGNGHASSYRALVRGLASRGHDVLFLERDAPWYAANRDLPRPPYCRVGLYGSLDALADHYADAVRTADLVIVGSYVPEGIAVIDWVLRQAHRCTAFYDIDTPVTIAGFGRNGHGYLDAHQIPRFDIYLSFTGGPTLDLLEAQFGAKMARPLYCSVDLEAYAPDPAVVADCDLSYLGTYSADRQPTLDALLLAPARAWPLGRFAIAGAQYPKSIEFPDNVSYTAHLSPREHPAFYRRSRFTLNVTRHNMITAGFSPSVRLFEAAACGVPIISDRWPGLSTFFVPGEDILVADRTDDVLALLRMPDRERIEIGLGGRRRVLEAHTGPHRAAELEGYVAEVTRLTSPAAADTIARPA